MLNQFIAGLGAALVLAGYFAFQRGWLAREDRVYNALNFVMFACLRFYDRSRLRIIRAGALGKREHGDRERRVDKAHRRHHPRR